MASITQTTVIDADKLFAKTPLVKFHDLPTPEEPDFPLPPPSINPTDILEIDQGTPDSHVPRDPRLIRLTGVHPFNVEPPLTALYKEGFLTSPELFYVRNHGPVPQVRDEDIPTWELSIEGLVEKPIVLTFRDILSNYDQITAPITLVCAGNRRKEQNTVRKSKGFSWGPAGLSTALFTGPMMGDILRSAKPLRKAKYVCMEGADKLPNGFYGTSVKLNWAMDPNKGIMLAYKMNGEPLRPDHGRPLRAVVPGQIGGRSVKWLTKLILTDTPSDNWYHINDNRVLPTMVSPEMSAQDRKWWHDERYAIYDLNVNSVAVYPQHEEEVDLATSGPTYNAKGYAYAGGGRRITRVEISLDKGKSWRLADIEYAEDKYREFEDDLFGGRVEMWKRETCFCWSFWSLNIPIADLESSDGLLVRAMDDALTAQPRDMYWSVLGMMNNPWFRVAITKEGNSLKFEHPTHPTKAGGWMERVKKAGGDLTNGNWGERIEGEDPVEPEPVKEINMKKEGLNRQIDLKELKENSSCEKPWFVVNGEVYDGTAFLEGHPGGAISITASAGLDVSEDFLAIHSETAKHMMPDYHVGTLDKASLDALKNNSTATSNEPRPVFLQSRAWSKLKLIEIKNVSWDTRIFIFDLEHEKQRLGLPIGQHLMIKVPDPTTNEAIIRSYTPISDTVVEGRMELLVKIYFPTDTVPGGKMTMALDKLSLGAEIDCKGPTGRFEYLGNGRVLISGKERKLRSFKMICGGTGITPIFQVLRAIMQDSQDPTTCVVLDGNRLEEDILCRAELDAYVASDSQKCTVIHTLTKGSEKWEGRRGRISEELLKEYAAPESDSMVLLCGPEALEKSARKLLVAQGWAESDLHFF
ncbi:nitrate reductase (NADPH) niaD or niiA-Penicillium chrysogenum [Penicillium hispanicum]|uniref:nitrate reductase (NADPH) niaD or niiA-Penicillium chrysogenum n=1 Tax=Penicillium hispanicum TaxID=1080232 RepID=UPI002540DBF5|nr:nitrate reductase (NADPH) niaD or niiA-Penicillium chrysogenum [Penicillium hispanicum]KAJ5578256.1 nitrate reductase (NADPH) niaD or niiA-Penicillium chrysogenum [Penicillium hispanicum]